MIFRVHDSGSMQILNFPEVPTALHSASALVNGGQILGIKCAAKKALLASGEPASTSPNYDLKSVGNMMKLKKQQS